MNWMTRLLKNIQKKPVTISDRLKYLKTQMTLPSNERLLVIPEMDEVQPHYEM